jgi:hypothetical protein
MGVAAKASVEEVNMSRVTPEELAELQDPNTWEDEADPVRPPVKSPRAIVSVAFLRDDYLAVVDYASQHGMKTSELIRQAVLERIAPEGRPAIVAVTGGIQTGDVDIAAASPSIMVRTSPQDDPAAA